MLLIVEDRLIEVRDAPSLRDVKRKLTAEDFSGFGGHRVPPGAKRGKLPAVAIENEVAVHHGGDTEGAYAGQRDFIPLPDITL